MKLKNISKIKERDLVFYIEDDSLLTEDIQIKTTNQMSEANVVLINMAIGEKHTFEPEIDSVIACAEAEALNKLIFTYGYDLEKAHKVATESGIIKNEIGLFISPNAKKMIDSEKKDIGDFFYENVNGNGMIFANENIINLYNTNTFQEALKKVSHIIKTKKRILQNDYELEMAIEESNEYLNSGYENLLYQPLDITKENKENQLHSLNLEDKIYCIGDDVFFINKEEDKTMSQILLEKRMKEVNKLHTKKAPIEPFELVKDMTLNDLIKNNNALAKYSQSFIANLQTMPKEKFAVDTGSLYEIVLNLSKKGMGVVNVDENLYKSTSLHYYFKDKSKDVILMQNATAREVSLMQRIFYVYEYRTLNNKEFKSLKLKKGEFDTLIKKVKKVSTNNPKIYEEIEKEYKKYKKSQLKTKKM